jgi:hypothetical protein
MSDARKVLADTLAGDPVPKRVRTNLDGTPVAATRRDYAAAGYGMTRSAYVTALVMGQPLPPPAPLAPGSDAMLLAIAGNRVVAAIAGVQKRIAAGDDAGGLLPELRAIQRNIAGGQLSLRPAYDAALDARTAPGEDQWDDNEAPELSRKRGWKPSP